MATRVVFSGGKSLEKALLELARGEARRVGREALRKVGKKIVDQARANVPVKEGRLKKAIEIKFKRAARGQTLGPQMEAEVRVSKKGGFRARKSDRQSRVKGKLGPARYGYQIGSRPDVYGQFVEYGHGNGPAQPFMRPAWDSDGGRIAMDRMGEELWKGLDRAAARAAKRR
jgi:HK97 gp10 family phage protein